MLGTMKKAYFIGIIVFLLLLSLTQTGWQRSAIELVAFLIVVRLAWLYKKRRLARTKVNAKATTKVVNQ